MSRFNESSTIRTRERAVLAINLDRRVENYVQESRRRVHRE